MINYYSLLKISPTAQPTDVELAFTKFKEELVNYSPGIQLTEVEVKIKFPDIWKAYEILLDPLRRKNYDDELKINFKFDNEQSEEIEIDNPIKSKYERLTRIVLYFLLAISGLVFMYFMVPHL